MLFRSTELLAAALLVGGAVSYLIEVLDLVLPRVSTTLLKLVVALPLAVGGNYLLGQFWHHVVVTAPASTLIALTISRFINRPIAVRNNANLRSFL